MSTEETIKFSLAELKYAKGKWTIQLQFYKTLLELSSEYHIKFRFDDSVYDQYIDNVKSQMRQDINDIKAGLFEGLVDDVEAKAQKKINQLETERAVKIQEYDDIIFWASRVEVKEGTNGTLLKLQLDPDTCMDVVNQINDRQPIDEMHKVIL